uniref:Uncharacterized protein n=1 Tax=Mesocestoides corti TaxID=53468 RepID=A0A5K3G2W9_MESCO
MLLHQPIRAFITSSQHHSVHKQTYFMASNSTDTVFAFADTTISRAFGFIGILSESGTAAEPPTT